MASIFKLMCRPLLVFVISNHVAPDLLLMMCAPFVFLLSEHERSIPTGDVATSPLI